MLFRCVVGVLLVVANSALAKNCKTVPVIAPACEAWKSCTSPDDCGIDGKCVGSYLGKCNCNACVNFWPCRDDSACGGLKGACDTSSGTCRCWQALERAGFPFIKAASELCNVKKCSADEDACFGLPCNTGRCVCKDV